MGCACSAPRAANAVDGAHVAIEVLPAQPERIGSSYRNSEETEEEASYRSAVSETAEIPEKAEIPELYHDASEITDLLTSSSFPHEQRLCVAMMVGYAEATQPTCFSAPSTPRPPRPSQESVPPLDLTATGDGPANRVELHLPPSPRFMRPPRAGHRRSESAPATPAMIAEMRASLSRSARWQTKQLPGAIPTPNRRATPKRAAALVLGLRKRAAGFRNSGNSSGGGEGEPPSAVEAVPAAAYNEAFLGRWEQESMETAKLEEILKAQGYNWAIRKVALGAKLNMTFSVDDDGDLLYTSKVPVQGEQRLKCINGASLDVKLLGTRMTMAVHWADGALVMSQRTVSGGKETCATITQRYDAARDRIISENESVEGFYTRTFRRVGS